LDEFGKAYAAFAAEPRIVLWVAKARHNGSARHAPGVLSAQTAQLALAGRLACQPRTFLGTD